jgi:hypothetical protein
MRKDFALLLLLVLITLIAGFIYSTSFKIDGFADSASIQSSFVTRQQRTFNPIGLALTAAGTQGALGTSANPLINTVGIEKNTPLAPGPNGLFASIEKCEAVKTDSCSAFDDPSFTSECGICLDIGTNSKNAPATGGLVLLPEDRANAQDKAVGNFIPNYVPTVGTCPANRMVATKAECLRLARQIKCEKSANYDLSDCSQCYSDTTYSIVDLATNPSLNAGAGTLYLVGNGTLNFAESGFATKNNIKLSPTVPQVIQLQGPESTRVSLSVGQTSDGTSPLIAGYMSGVTAKGTFTIDIYRIVMTDSLTGRKPRTSGSLAINGINITKLNPGFGQSQMALVLVSPFTFVDPLSQEAAMCKDAPFVTKQASAEFLGSDPCYKKGSGPGKFSMECLQGIFLSNGCLDQGTGYPKDDATSSALMANANGAFRSINDIATLVYSSAVKSSTGIDTNGQNLSIDDWSNASVFCTGTPITSPCDIAAKNTGPLTVECLDYLWKNQGSSKLKNGVQNPLGPTYNAGTLATSLFTSGKDIKDTSRYCTPDGTMAPLDANGKPNNTAVKYWQGQGGVAKVKSIMANLHSMANSDNISDDVRKEYLAQCYGSIPLAGRPTLADTRKIDLRQGFNINTSIPLVNGTRGDTNFGGEASRNWTACLQAAMNRYPSGNIGVTFAPGSCWAVPMNPDGPGSNPGHPSWTSAFVTDCQYPSGTDAAGFCGRAASPGVQFVRIGDGSDGQDGWLMLSQVVVKDKKGVNIARSKKVNSTPQAQYPSWGRSPETAVDGNELVRAIPNNYHSNTPNHPFWEVDLGLPSEIASVIIYQQGNGSWERITKGMKITLMDANRNVLSQLPITSASQIIPFFVGGTKSSPMLSYMKCANLPKNLTPTPNTIIGKVLTTGDFTLSFDITPKGIIPNWASILLFNSNGLDCCNPGERTPGIWFVPGALGLHVRIGDTSGSGAATWAGGGNWGFDNQLGCAIGKKSSFKLECYGKNVKLTLDSTVWNLTQPTTRYAGLVNVYSGGPHHPPANVLIENLCYVGSSL